MGEVIHLGEEKPIEKLVAEIEENADKIEEMMTVIFYKDNTYNCFWTGGDDYLRKVGMLEVLKLDIHIRKAAGQ